MQIKIETLAAKVFNNLVTDRLASFSRVKELVGSDDKASRVLQHLLDHERIVKLDKKEWKRYGIKESDKRKTYYVLAEDDSASREWIKVSKAIEEAVKLPKETPDEDLIVAIMSVFPLPDGDLPRGTRMSKFRSGKDIELLVALYDRITQRNNDTDYRRRWAILGFIYDCVTSGTLVIGDIGKTEMSNSFREIVSNALPEIIHYGNNALNSTSPMAVSFDAFRISLALNQRDVIPWIESELNKMLDLIDPTDVRGLHKAVIFQHMIGHYRISYPNEFRLESIDNFSLNLLDRILDRNTTSEVRNVLQAVRGALVDPI